MTRYARRYRKVARSLSRLELMRTSMDDSWEDPRDLVSAGPRRFLDFYGDEGILLGLERYGFLDALHERGYGNIELITKAADERHTLIVEGTHPEMAEPTHLVELVVRRDRLVPEADIGLDGVFDVLTVDWLTLRHPVGEFSSRRPQLPGQDAPGLGFGEQVAELLYRVVDRLRLDGMLTVPEYFHNAIIYGRELRHFDPAEEGRCSALASALLDDASLTLAQASWAVDWGHVYERGEPIEWKGEAQLRATSASLQRYLTSTEHRRAAERSAETHHYALDRERYEAQWRARRDLLEGRVSRSGE